MNIIVFGATGGTGLATVSQALDKGYQVTAFVRDSSKLDISHPSLRVVAGDVLDAPDVGRAVAGHKVVVCALGGGKSIRNPGTIFSTGTKNILDSMTAHHVPRIICLTAVLVGDAAKHISAPGKAYIGLMKLISPDFLNEREEQERLVRESGLEWVIARPATLTDGERTGMYRIGTDLKTGFSSKISRADVADFMLSQVEKTNYFYTAPTLIY